MKRAHGCIKYSDTKRTYLGRNGTGHQRGISATTVSSHVHINAINSRDGAARCFMEIPMEDLAGFIQLLQDIQESYAGTSVKTNDNGN